MHGIGVLHVSVGASILLHGVALSVHFKFPDAIRFKAPDTHLEVVLVNARTREKPAKADLLAQANLDRGGNTDKAEIARSALPVTRPRDPGRDLVDAKRRVQQLEEQQRKLLAQARRKTAAKVPVETGKPTPTPTEAAPATPSGRELADLSMAALKLQAAIDRQTHEYQKRPRKKFIGARATEYRFAQYEEDWRLKVERVGTLNYPPEARGKLYGNLRLTVTLRPDGVVDSIELDRSSKLKVLDEAAFRIVRMAAPYGAFPPEIRRDTDLLVITRTWFFGDGDQVWTK
ncbi:MAG: TonB family protein [Proteobacteria bacterium]|nr:TonB family protein [Pseudomonadota bacterium]